MRLLKLLKKLTRRLNKFYPVAVILAIYTLILMNNSLENLSSNNLQEQHRQRRNTETSKNWKSIVWFDLFHGGLRMNAKSVHMNLCEYKQCMINFIDNKQQFKDYFPTADAVIFQGGRLKKTPPKRAHENQVYVFSTIESPLHLSFSHGSKRWNKAINWTMTYRLDSDILYKYGSLESNSETNLLVNKNYTEIFKQKTKEAAWLVSDCPTESKREKYVQILRKYMRVDVYGRCGPYKNCTKQEGKKCLEQIGKDYKFYLSFENSICKDYMTEKVFRWFNMDTITVVRGARNYENLLPNNTYVDTDQFDSIQKLSEYLQKLGNDEREYIKYLKEKDKYKTELLLTQVQRAYCDLCKRLHNIDDYRKHYEDINQWWFKNTCQRNISDIH